MGKKQNGKAQKAKDVLKSIQRDYVARYNEMLMVEVDEAKDLVIKGINRQIGEIYRLLEIVDITNYEDVFNVYDIKCEQIASVDLAVIFANLFDDITTLEGKRDLLFKELAVALDLPLPLNTVQNAYKQVQVTCNNEFKRYWKMSVQELCHEINESFLFAQSLMLQELRKLDSMASKNNTSETLVETVETVNVEYRKITDRRELMDLASENGFTLKRQCGSHKIYENADGKVVVIADHSYDIGKHISHEIQKQILNN